jgi:hypothetical protein
MTRKTLKDLEGETDDVCQTSQKLCDRSTNRRTKTNRTQMVVLAARGQYIFPVAVCMSNKL